MTTISIINQSRYSHFHPQICCDNDKLWFSSDNYYLNMLHIDITLEWCKEFINHRFSAAGTWTYKIGDGVSRDLTAQGLFDAINYLKQYVNAAKKKSDQEERTEKAELQNWRLLQKYEHFLKAANKRRRFQVYLNEKVESFNLELSFLKRENVYYCYLCYAAELSEGFTVYLVCHGKNPFDLHDNFKKVTTITIDDTVINFDTLICISSKNKVKDHVTNVLYHITELESQLELKDIIGKI